MDIAERVEEFVRVSSSIQWELITWRGNSDHSTLEQVSSEYTKEFVLLQNWQEFRNDLELGLTKRFVSYNESALKNEFANYLIRKLHEVLLPTFSLASQYHNATIEPFIDLNNSKKSIITPAEERICANYKFSGKVNNALFYCCLSVIDKIREFTPELYNQHDDIWSGYIQQKDKRQYLLRAIPGPVSADQQPQPSEPGVKLQWNGSNRVLYDLFAQLTLMDVKPGKRLVGNTIKELARFLSDHVEGFPAPKTIERELEKMREPNGMETAKRGRIDLHITRDDK